VVQDQLPLIAPRARTKPLIGGKGTALLINRADRNSGRRVHRTTIAGAEYVN
jgi:hypothetical protein